MTAWNSLLLSCLASRIYFFFAQVLFLYLCAQFSFMKKIFYCLFLIVLPTLNVLGQKDLNSREPLQLEVKDAAPISVKELWKGIEGSYQFVISKESYQIVHSKSLYDLIMSSRKKDEDIRMTIDEYTVLFLPAENTLSSSSFVELEPVIYSK